MRRLRLKLSALLFAAIATAAAAPAAEWKRYFANGPMAETWDLAVAHPLSYFLIHPCFRSDPEDRIITCPKQSSAGEPQRQLPAPVQQTMLGTLGFMKIVQLDYFLPAPVGDAGPHLRSVLVEESPGSFREIYVARKLYAASVLLPGDLLHVGTLQLLRLRFSGARSADFYEDYFVLSGGAVEQLDMGLVYEAADLAVPSGKMPWHAWSRFDFPDIWRAAVAGEDGDCCRGTVTVRFRIEGTRGKVTAAKYDPSADAAQLRPPK